MLPPPTSFCPKSWVPPCQAAQTSDDLRSHNRNRKCSSAALAHACFLRGYRFLPRAQATPVVHNLTEPVSVSSSEHPWPGHDDSSFSVQCVHGPTMMTSMVRPVLSSEHPRLDHDDVHGLIRSEFRVPWPRHVDVHALRCSECIRQRNGIRHSTNKN